jgi:hypothetical protein
VACHGILTGDYNFDHHVPEQYLVLDKAKEFVDAWLKLRPTEDGSSGQIPSLHL